MKRIIFFTIILLAYIWSTALYAAPHQTALREFIIDTDVAMDDAIAILYLLKQPNIKIKAITIESNGNAHCKPAYANIKGILKLVNQTTIPVACGRETPLLGNHHFPKKVLDHCDALGGVGFSSLNVQVPKQTAKALLISTLQSSSHPVNILAIGPMTTIAEVITAHPRLKQKIRMIYAMGGAINVAGNIKDVDAASNNLVAEWNIYIDPFAAQKVFHSGIPITLVPLDATNQARVDHVFYERIKQSHTTIASKFVYEMLDHNNQLLVDGIWYFWDPMAAVIASDDSFATLKSFPLSIRLNPESLSGATIIDKEHGTPIRVCMKIDSKRFKEKLLKGLNS